MADEQCVYVTGHKVRGGQASTKEFLRTLWHMWISVFDCSLNIFHNDDIQVP